MNTDDMKNLEGVVLTEDQALLYLALAVWGKEVALTLEQQWHLLNEEEIESAFKEIRIKNILTDREFTNLKQSYEQYISLLETTKIERTF
jgi:hypothetical protein